MPVYKLVFVKTQGYATDFSDYFKYRRILATADEYAYNCLIPGNYYKAEALLKLKVKLPAEQAEEEMMRSAEQTEQIVTKQPPEEITNDLNLAIKSAEQAKEFAFFIAGDKKLTEKELMELNQKVKYFNSNQDILDLLKENDKTRFQIMETSVAEKIWFMQECQEILSKYFRGYTHADNDKQEVRQFFEKYLGLEELEIGYNNNWNERIVDWIFCSIFIGGMLSGVTGIITESWKAGTLAFIIMIIIAGALCLFIIG